MIQRFFRESLIFMFGFIALIYLINPGAGFIEFIPDNLPLVGNLDEAGATVLLMSVLGHYGIDLTTIIPQKRKKVIRRVPKRKVKSERRSIVIDSQADEDI